MRPARRLWASADGRAACLLAGCVLLFFAPIVAQRGVYFVGNSIEYFARFSYTADQLRAGRLPLWNPHHALGLSHAADPKAQAAYPVHLLLFLVLPKAAAYGCDVVFHVLLATLGMFFLARAWGRSAEAAFLAGLSYGLGGFVLAHLQHFNHVVAIAWLPMLFLCVERFLETGSRMALGLGALTLGLQILGGHSQVVLYGGFVVGARVLMRLAQEWRSGSGAAGRAILPLLGMVVAGLGLSALFSVPYLELMTFSGRAQGMDLEYATSFSLEPARLAAFLYPFLFGGSPWGPERGPGSFAEMSPYVGLLPLCLAAVALTRRNGRIVFLAALACGGLILALGGYTPLGRLVFDLPVLRTGRAPARFLLAVTFALALLSAFGLDALRAGVARRRTGVLAGALLLVAAAPVLVAALGRMGHTLPRTMLGLVPDRLPSYAGIAFAVASAGVLMLWSRNVLRPDALVRLTLAVAVADLFFFAASLWGTYNATIPVSFYTDASAPARRLIADGDQPRFEYWSLGEEKLFSFVQKVDLPTYRELARDGLRASLPMTFAVRAQQGDWGDKLLAYADWQSAIGARGRFDHLAARLVGMFGGRYVLSQNPLALEDLRPVLQAGRIRMYRNAAEQPRAFVVSRATVVEDRTAALRAIQDPAFDPRAAVVLEPPARPLVAAGAPGFGANIRVDDPEHVVVDVRSSHPAYLVLNDTFYPGWRATIDGRPTRIYRANSLVRAVAVDAGDCRVEFLYDPVTPKIGATLSAVSLLALALYLGRQWRRS